MHIYSLTNSPLNFIDEYIKYITKERDKDINNFLQWWWDYQLSYPNLLQIEYNLFVKIGISSEYECSFSKASYIMAAWKNNLNGNIIEARKALQLWVISDVIELSTLV